jgi:hypothetical protein
MTNGPFVTDEAGRLRPHDVCGIKIGSVAHHLRLVERIFEVLQ